MLVVVVVVNTTGSRFNFAELELIKIDGRDRQ